MAAPDETQQKMIVQELNMFGMFTPAPGTEGRRSRLSWGALNGNPRITVFTNVPTDNKGKGVISAPMYPQGMFVLLDKLEEIAQGPSGNKWMFKCLRGKKDEKTGRQTGEKILMAEVYVGKDDNGMVWICLRAPDRPNIKFEFKFSDYLEVYKSNGQPLTAQEGSVLEAVKTAQGLRSAFARITGEFRDPTQFQRKPGTENQRNTYNASQSNKPQSSQGSNTTSLEFDEDLNF